jgi:hypothetical protein
MAPPAWVLKAPHAVLFQDAEAPIPYRADYFFYHSVTAHKRVHQHS